MGSAMMRWLAAVGFLFAFGTATPAFAETPTNERVELNSATSEQLCTLPGIGPKRAALILERRRRRPFTRPTQLLEVRGIGRKTLRKIRPFIRIEPPLGRPKRAARSVVLGRPRQGDAAGG